LVEGYFDVIALHAAGFQNVVATCGTALTVDHLNIFRRFASKITVLFDGDRAGITATERAMETGLAQGVVLFGAAMPEDLDPDELLFDQQTGMPIAEGRSKMEAILAGSKPLLDAQIANQVAEAMKGPEARTQALKQIGQWLASFTDPVGREVRMQDVQGKLGISRQLLEQAAFGSRPSSSGPARGPRLDSRPDPRSMPGPLLPVPRAGPRAFQTPPKMPQKGPVRPSSADISLLRGLAHGGKTVQRFREIRQNLPPDLTIADLFDYFPARAFLARYLVDNDLPEGFVVPQSAGNDPDIDPQVRSILTEAWISGPQKPPEGALNGEGDPDVELRGALNRGIGRLWARFSQRIRAALEDAEAKKDAGLHARLSKEYLDLQRKMKEFISFYDEA
jgi:DNA primase